MPASILTALFVVSLLAPWAAWAQTDSVVLTGTVVDAETGAPLAGANVFIAGSMMGAATDAAGRFRLGRVPLGAHRVFVSMLGYEPASRDTLLRRGPSTDVTFRLTPVVIEMGEVTVSARGARRWQRRLRTFERLFLGESDQAALTRIVNPEVLSFESRWGRFTATASRPLIIENRALGYRIQYFLKEFIRSGNTIKYDGEPLYEPLEPEHDDQAARWAANRRKAFYGSFRHYMLTLLGGRWQEEGFITYRRFSLEHLHTTTDRFGVDPKRLLRDGPSPQEKELRFSGFLEVLYINEREDEAFLRWQGRATGRAPGNQRSWIKLNDGPTLVDQAGEVIDPYGVTVYGYFAFERIADEVPKEYRPEEWIVR